MDGRGPQAPEIDDARELVRVFDHDPALLATTDGATARFLRDHGTVPSVRLAPGVWHPPMHRVSARHWLALMVVDGFVARPVRVDDRRVLELLGPGDLLRPWDRPRWEGAAAARLAWPVLTPARIAVLDQQFAAVTARAPALMSELLSRALARSARVAAAVAIADAGEPEARVQRVLADVADRWGEPVVGGMALPSVLGEEAVAQLAGADVPVASEALAALAARGVVARNGDALVFAG